MVGPLTPQPGETSAQFKDRIEKAQKDLAAQRTPPPPVAQPPASVPTPPPTPEPAAPAPAAPPLAQPSASAPKTGAAPVVSTPAKSADQVDPLEWARNKGLKTPEDIARSLRSLETEFHRRNQAPPPQAPPSEASPNYGQPRPSAPPYQPPPAPYQPPASGGYPPPYQPAPRYAPQPAPLPRSQVKWIAETYQLPEEDAERLAPMVMDMVAVAQRQADQRFQRLERDNARNGEMFRLMQDPSFQHPEVQFEMHRILEAEPRIFELEPAPYTVAFNMALTNIARKLVTAGKAAVPTSEAPPLTTRPPSPLGGDGGSGGSGKTPDAPLNPETFNALPLDKKREMLTAIGARPRT